MAVPTPPWRRPKKPPGQRTSTTGSWSSCTGSSSKTARSNGGAQAATSWPTAPSGTGKHSPRSPSGRANGYRRPEHMQRIIPNEWLSPTVTCPWQPRCGRHAWLRCVIWRRERGSIGGANVRLCAGNPPMLPCLNLPGSLLELLSACGRVLPRRAVAQLAVLLLVRQGRSCGRRSMTRCSAGPAARYTARADSMTAALTAWNAAAA